MDIVDKIGPIELEENGYRPYVIFLNYVKKKFGWIIFTLNF